MCRRTQCRLPEDIVAAATRLRHGFHPFSLARLAHSLCLPSPAPSPLSSLSSNTNNCDTKTEAETTFLSRTRRQYQILSRQQETRCPQSVIYTPPPPSLAGPPCVLSFCRSLSPRTAVVIVGIIQVQDPGGGAVGRGAYRRCQDHVCAP